MKRERLTKKFAATAADQKKKPAQTSKAKVKGELERDTSGFEYDTSKAKHLKRALHNVNVSLGTLFSAMKELALLRGSEVTPDGKLGGRGFVMNFKDMKAMLNEAVGNLSDITDTLADELTNPKWGLSKEEVRKVKKEKGEIEETVEDVKDVAESIETGQTPEEIQPTEVIEEEIQPEDVKDSSDLDSLKRYKHLLDGESNDKVASVLSKNILANLSKGD